MPVHIEQLNTEVTASSDNMPWSAEQIETLITMVLERLERKDRSEREQRAETRLRPSALSAWRDE